MERQFDTPKGLLEQFRFMHLLFLGFAVWTYVKEGDPYLTGSVLAIGLLSAIFIEFKIWRGLPQTYVDDEGITSVYKHKRVMILWDDCLSFHGNYVLRRFRLKSWTHSIYIEYQTRGIEELVNIIATKTRLGDKVLKSYNWAKQRKYLTPSK